MAVSDRYDLASSAEGQFEPGSNNTVLRNRLGITDPAQMELVEFDSLAVVENELLLEVETDQAITVRDLCEWHGRWLGGVYEWAGMYRTVNMAKGDFLFAASHLIPALMQRYEENFLGRFTPCEGLDETRLCEALAICHVELIIIHPFREGNGRLSRLLATLMALQAGAPLLDFGEMERSKDRYIEAVHLGHMGDYRPMQDIFFSVFQSSLG